jgi:hypothetical protein
MTSAPRPTSSSAPGRAACDRRSPWLGTGAADAAICRVRVGSSIENPFPRSGLGRTDTKSSATFCAMDAHQRDCEYCQRVRRASDTLRFKRLGAHERRQLLAAGAPGDEPNRIHPPGSSQAEQTATRRAVANLVGAGLLRLSPERLRLLPGRDDRELARLRRKYSVVRQAWRTELGEEIARLYRPELESGRRIRWLVHLNAATAAALARCPYRPRGNKRQESKGSARVRRVGRGLVSGAVSPPLETSDDGA